MPDIVGEILRKHLGGSDPFVKPVPDSKEKIKAEEKSAQEKIKAEEKAAKDAEKEKREAAKQEERARRNEEAAKKAAGIEKIRAEVEAAQKERRRQEDEAKKESKSKGKTVGAAEEIPGEVKLLAVEVLKAGINNFSVNQIPVLQSLDIGGTRNV